MVEKLVELYKKDIENGVVTRSVLYNTSVFYGMCGYYPEATIKDCVEALDILREYFQR